MSLSAYRKKQVISIMRVLVLVCSCFLWSSIMRIMLILACSCFLIFCLFSFLIFIIVVAAASPPRDNMRIELRNISIGTILLVDHQHILLIAIRGFWQQYVSLKMDMREWNHIKTNHAVKTYKKIWWHHREHMETMEKQVKCEKMLNYKFLHSVQIIFDWFPFGFIQVT